MKFTITFKREAIKELKLLPSKIVQKLKTAIDGLADNPRPSGCKKLEGKKENIWRIRVGDYRVFLFSALGHPRNFFE